jgi:tRNA A-37 threonylcarbamoyl transferase component Bud32
MPNDDVTRLAPGSAPGSKPATSAGTMSGWLTSSGAIDHGRFPPGTLLGGRYRIVGRLGKGGMGEVYRADDLKIGQQVALKFLPAEVDRDPARLTQLHTEVRMARQVSHPNVCRVYDIDEEDGHTFLSMEYVDGEDLASLLKRIGRFSEDRAVEIAGQICAGLAAAHQRGVIHRDFKPANVMIDGVGHVRITDFGLAGVSGEMLRAGTPAYMAPEQLAGAEVTARSDLYAVGLVLYEIFTGRRAIEANNLAELIHRREQVGITPPSAIVRDLSPQIESAIMRCLSPDPADRPASALAVRASLPGGDPLAAALAAGETPSPEMVAAAGRQQAISARAAAAGAAWIVVSLLAILLMYERVMLVNRVPPAKSPAALQDRAEEALTRLGYGDGVVARAGGMGVSLDFARYVDATSQAPDRWNQLRSGRPETFLFWHRTSPRPLVPLGDEHRLDGTNPPLNIAGMTTLVVDGSGRLAEFLAVPEPAVRNTPARQADWSLLFVLAGLDMSTFAEVAPEWVPPVFADERRAWEGPLPEHPGQTFRVEASALAGRTVSFVLTGPWSRSARAAQPVARSAFNRFVDAVTALVMPALMLAAAALAWGNLKRGRGDRRGASRAAGILFLIAITGWLLGNQHTGALGQDLGRFFGAIGRALFDAALVWLTYLGLEPYIRRFSPDSLVGWTRLLGGRWRDPQVGSDVLVGVCAGLGMTVLYAVHNLIPPLFGRPEPMPMTPADPTVLLGARFVIGRMLSQIGGAFSAGMLAVCGVIAILIVARRKWLAHAIASLIFVWVVIEGMFPAGTPVLDLLIGFGIILIWTGVILHAGLLSTVVALSTHFVLLRAPMTTDISSWRGTPALTYLLVVGGAGLLAAYLARAARTASPAAPG